MKYLLALTLLLSACATNPVVKFNGVNLEDPTLVDVIEGAVTLTGTAPEHLKPRDFRYLNSCKPMPDCYGQSELLWKGHE